MTEKPGTPSRDPVPELGAMVQGEARRMLSEAQLRPNPARLAAGWQRRFVTDAVRAAEAVELYEELGFEAVADPIEVGDVGEQCDGCRVLAALRFRTVYTRPKP